MYVNCIEEFQKVIAAKIDLAHTASDVIYSEVLIYNCVSDGNINMQKKI
jgi:hypothetical protein